MPIVSFVPLFMFAILFGLSMDYNVFLQSRICEEYHRGAGPSESVVLGLARVARIILAAGAIMAAVFLSFVGDPDVVVKMIGLGLAAAILIDVLVVRLIVAPAVIALLGDRAWGLPGWLDQVLRGSRSRATSTARRRCRACRPPNPRAVARFGRVADFTPFDTRGYRTVDVRSGYGEWVATYEQTVEDAMDIELLESLEQVRWSSEVADLGCGTGRTGIWLREQGVEAIDGVDLTPEMLEIARQRGVHRRLVEADVAATGLPDEAYDLVVTSLVDEHLADLRPLYAEAYRLAARGDVRAGRLPPALHHGRRDADPLRQRVGRAGGDRDPRAPAERAHRRRARRGVGAGRA